MKSTMTINQYGDKEWRNEKGERHREDGPAIEYTNGTKYWYLNGKFHRKDGPAVEYSDGTKYWYLNGKFHRKDGPAIEYTNGDKHWYLNGQLHREDGPAVECANGGKYYYLNSKEYSEADFLKLTAKPLFSEKELSDLSGALAFKIDRLEESISPFGIIKGEEEAQAVIKVAIERLSNLMEKVNRVGQ